MKYKLIAFDFDGTILNKEGNISIKTRKILQNLKNQGYIIVGVTGRNLKAAISVIDSSLFNYLIVNNGANIYDTINNIDIFKRTIEKNTIVELTDNIKNICREIKYLSQSYYYVYLRDNEYYSSCEKQINELNEINDEIIGIEIFLKKEELISDCNKYLQKNFDFLNSFVMQDSFASKKWIIILSKNINKAIALINLSHFLNIKVDEIIFFGDGLNDLEVFKSEIFSVAMGNSLNEIKKNASDITLSNNDDGVVMYLEKLINKE